MLLTYKAVSNEDIGNTYFCEKWSECTVLPRCNFKAAVWKFIQAEQSRWGWIGWIFAVLNIFFLSSLFTLFTVVLGVSSLLVMGISEHKGPLRVFKTSSVIWLHSSRIDYIITQQKWERTFRSPTVYLHYTVVIQMTPHESFQELEKYFWGFLIFAMKKYFSSQKLILSMKILNKSIWQVTIYMFCIKPTAERNNFENDMAESTRS